jgi:phosphatidylserine synthase 2
MSYLVAIPVLWLGSYWLATYKTSNFFTIISRLGTCIYTSLLLVGIFFTDRNGALSFLQIFGVGFPLPEKDYGDVCQIYTPDHASGDPFFNITDRIDIFVLAHSLGWFVKTVILRDVRVAWICSILFEVVEICFAHLLPNFNECWWDAIIFDIFGCNLIGIHAADMILGVLGAEKFDFLKKSKINHKYLFCSFLMVLLITMIDLNFFFLKFVMFVPTTHWMAYLRTLLWVLISAPSAIELNKWAKSNQRGKNSARRAFPELCPSCMMGITGLAVEVIFYYTQSGDLFAFSAPTPIYTIILSMSLLYATVYSFIKI